MPKQRRLKRERQDGGILDVDRLPADDAGEACHGFHAQAGDVHGQVEPHDAEPGQMAAAATVADALPGLAIFLLRQPGLIGDDVDFDAVDPAQQTPCE